MVKKSTPKKKKVKGKKKKPKTIGKNSGIALPLPNFPTEGKGLQKFCIETAKFLDHQSTDLDEHRKNKYFKIEDVLIHLRHTNHILDRLLYLVIFAIHMHTHTEEGIKQVSNMKKAISKVDKNFKDKEPVLNYIGKTIKEKMAQEKRSGSIYG